MAWWALVVVCLCSTCVANIEEEMTHFMDKPSDASVMDDIIAIVDANKDKKLQPDELKDLYGKMLLSTTGGGAAVVEDSHDGHGHHHAYRLLVDTAMAVCLSPIFLLQKYDAIPNDFALDATEMQGAFRRLMLMKATPVCVGTNVTAAAESDCVASSSAKVWFYALLATFIISIISLVGVSLLPLLAKMPVMPLFVGLAVGALLGDTFLHLIPKILGVHGDDGHGHTPPPQEDPLPPMMIVMATFIAFFIMELIMTTYAEVRDEQAELAREEHDHQHGFQQNHDHDRDHKNLDSAAPYPTPPEQMPNNHPTPNPTPALENVNGHAHGAFENGAVGAVENGAAIVDNISETESEPIKIFGWLNLVSDAFHNFVDGMALGATFSLSTSNGITTSVAILFHEVPQEVGDFAILLEAGFSKKTALLFNFASAMVSVVGCCVGVGIGQSSKDAEKWLLAITSGCFVYVAAADMVPALLGAGGHAHDVPNDFNRYVKKGCALFGMLLGWMLMYIIAITETHGDCE